MTLVRAVARVRLPAAVLALAAWAACRSQPPPGRGSEGPSDVHIVRADSGAPVAATVDEICVGEAHGCARLQDGRVACWGDNGFHQVSSVDLAQLDAPRVADALPKATKLRCGRFETCVLDRDGGVDCVGSIYSDLTRPASDAAPDRDYDRIALPGPARDLALEAGGGCAILLDGSVVCWLATTYPEAPFAVEGIHDAAAFAAAPAGARFACLTRTSSEPACIGFAGRSLTHPEKGVPRWFVPLPALAGAQQLLVSDVSPRVCGRDPSGLVRCVDVRNEHQPEPPRPLGPGDPLWVGDSLTCLRGDAGARCESAQPSPLTAGVPADLTAIAVSPAIARSGGHACALVRGGVVCWGQASSGQLGDGTRYLHPPEPVPGVDEAQSLAAGEDLVCAGRKGGRLTCWGKSGGWHAIPDAGVIDLTATDPVDELAFGRNDRPCLRRSGRWVCRHEDGTWQAKGKEDDREEPIFAAEHVPVAVLSADGTCGIDAKGRVGCFERTTLANPRASLGWAEGDFVQVASPFSHYVAGIRRTLACARTKSGTVRCFRVLEEGPRLEPMDLPGVAALADVTNLVASTRSPEGVPRTISLVCATTRAGDVFCWGDGQFGQLPGRAPGADLAPVKIEGLPRIIDVALGGTFGCARGVDGRVYCWGSNREGGAPDGAPRERSMPVPVRWPPAP